MKRHLAIFASLFLIAFSTASAGEWGLDISHSKVGFSVTHLVITEVEGTFKKFDAKVSTKGDDWTNAQVEFTIDAASVNTDNEDRDKHLRSEDFFATDKNPNFTFKSTSFKKVSGNKWKLSGNFTMRGVTKPIVLDVVYGGQVKDPWGNTKAGFKVTGQLNRRDYGVNWSKSLDQGGLVVSDEVKLMINLELNKKS